jgi:type I restriction enzyme R subunit
MRKLLNPSSPSLLTNNRTFHQLLRDGVAVEIPGPRGKTKISHLRLADFHEPDENDWLVVNQFTVVDGHHNRRPDLVVFLNGLPVAVIELKNVANEGATIQDAFHQLQTYKKQIPALFSYNELLVISDGLLARVGTLTAPWERFAPWRTVDGEQVVAPGALELSTLLTGMFDKARLLDLVHGFIVFEEAREGVVKKLAGYHQVGAVRAALAQTVRATRPGGDRKVGVVWHTQGSGKSLTMTFYAGRVIDARAMDNPTLVVITDRNDLDEQLFGTFSRCHELLRQQPVQAESREHLIELLRVASGGVVFTTIQKFLPEDKGGRFEVLSDRRNIVVIADEAHRSQYGFKSKMVKSGDLVAGFAQHMRDALPHASYIGFTGTPIELTDKNTRAVFGDYISVYDIQRAVEDGATVPIYYESRLAQLKLDPELARRDRRRVRGGHRAGGGDPPREAQVALGPAGGGGGRREAHRAHRPGHRAALRAPHRGAGRQGDGGVYVAPHLRGDVQRARRAPAQVARHPRRGRRHEGGDVRRGLAGAALPGPHPQLGAPRGAGHPLPRPHGPAARGHRARHVADRVRCALDAHALRGQAHAGPRADAGHRARQPRLRRQGRRPGGGLPRPGRQPPQGHGHVHPGRRQGRAAAELSQALAVLREKLDVCRGFFHGFDYGPFLRGDRFERLRLLPPAMEHVLAQGSDGRERYLDLVLPLEKAYGLCASHDDAVAMRDEVTFFATVKVCLTKTTQASSGAARGDVEGAIRQLVSKALVTDGVIDVFAAAGLKKPEISILSDEFLDEVKGLPQRNLAVELLRKLLGDDLKTRRKSNVVQAEAFSAKLEKTVARYKNRAIETVQVIEELLALAKEVKAAKQRGLDLGLSDAELAFYDALGTNDSAVAVLGDKVLTKIARELAETIRTSVSIDWTAKETGLVPVGVAHHHMAVGEQGVLPVAARGAGAQELLFHRPGAGGAQPVAQAGDAGDAALALGALEDDADVVLAVGVGLERLIGGHPGPLAEQIDVAGVVHLIDQVGAARAAADLAEDGLALGGEEPLHVGEAAAHVEGLQHIAAQLDARLQARLGHVPHGDDDRADPLDGAHLDGLGQVGGDVLVGRGAVDAHRVEGELLALDVFLAAGFLHMAGGHDGRFELGLGAAAVGVGAARPRDGLEDERKADLFGGGPHLGFGAHAARARHPQAGGRHPLLHDLLVAKAAHVSTLMPGMPQRSRRRAARMTRGSQLASTWSTWRPASQVETRAGRRPRRGGAAPAGTQKDCA